MHTAVSYSKASGEKLWKDDSDKNRILTYFFPTISFTFSAFNQKITFMTKFGCHIHRKSQNLKYKIIIINLRQNHSLAFI